MTDFFIRAQKGWLVDRKIFHSLDILCKKVNILEYKLFGVRALYKSLRKLDRRMNLNFIFLLGSFVDINRRLFLFFFFIETQEQFDDFIIERFKSFPHSRR